MIEMKLQPNKEKSMTNVQLNKTDQRLTYENCSGKHNVIFSTFSLSQLKKTTQSSTIRCILLMLKLTVITDA